MTFHPVQLDSGGWDKLSGYIYKFVDSVADRRHALLNYCDISLSFSTKQMETNGTFFFSSSSLDPSGVQIPFMRSVRSLLRTKQC